MRAESLIGLTVELYESVLADARPPDAIARTFFRARKFLGSHDRAFISRATYGMLRYKSLLEELSRSAQQTDGVTIPATLGLIIAYLAAVPEENAGNIPEDFYDGAAAFAQCKRAEIEKIFSEIAAERTRNSQAPNEAQQEEDGQAIARIARVHAYPEWMVRRFIATLGAIGAEALCRAMNIEAPVTIRVNTLKATREECAKALSQENIITRHGEYSPDALTALKRLNIFATKTFREGMFEMQDEGSQIVSRVCDPHPAWKVMDACAGAGGKTLHIAALMHNRGEIFALVQNPFQKEETSKRLRRSGAQNARVFLPSEFAERKKRWVGAMNLVLLDAPCSGSGTIRRNPIAKWRIAEDKIAGYAEQQYTILQENAPFVRSGGILVYATCSVFRQENEEVVEMFLREHPEFKLSPFLYPPPTDKASIISDGFLKLYPHIHNTDGFFAAALTRT